MKKIFFVLSLMILMPVTTNSQEKSTIKPQIIKQKNAKYEFEVKGNCEMCKKRIEKVAYSVSGVKQVIWSVDEKKIRIILNEQKNEVDVVKSAISKVGHDTDNIKATDDAYNMLHGCCLYER